jgi:hypothetical protein
MASIPSLEQAKMNTRFLSAITVSAFFPLLASAQGTMILDQQSSDEANGGNNLNIIQYAQPTGQSFTPSLNGIGFVRFNLFDQNRNNGMGAVVYVNLRSDAIDGPIMDSTAPVAIPDNFGLPLNTGYVTFLFANTVPLQPGVTYFLQPVVQSGDLVGIFAGAFNYPGGAEYAGGNRSATADYWFQQGIVVPEPSSFILFLFGVGLLLYRGQKGNLPL